MSNKITDRVMKLIALANSTHSEEEARTAAREAVKLIGQHGLLSTLPQPKPPPPVWGGPVACKPSWTGMCEICRGKVCGKVYWLGKRVRHEACHAFVGRR